MCFCSRTCFGLFVGYLSLICYGLGTVCCIILLTQKDALDRAKEEVDADAKPYIDRRIVIAFLVEWSIMTIASGLLIKGIHKRRHRYMGPWLLLAVINVAIYVILAIIALVVGVHGTERVVTCLTGLGIQCLLICPIYTLYRDWRDDDINVTRRYYY